MLEEKNVKKVGDESVEEMKEMFRNEETISDRTEKDNDVGECVITAAPSRNNKEENIVGSIMEKLGKLKSKNRS